MSEEAEKPVEEQKEAPQDDWSSQKEAYEQRIKELEEAANPNWKDIREKMREKDKQLEEYKAKAKDNGLDLDVNTPLSQEEFARLAEQKAREVLLNDHKSREVSRYGERAEEVQSLADRFLSGQEVDQAKISDAVQMAARALQLDTSQNMGNTYVPSGGFIPKKEDLELKPKKFSDTEDGQNNMRMLGLTEVNAVNDLNKKPAGSA